MKAAQSIKVGIAKLLTAGTIGKVAAFFCGNEMPCRGLKFNTADPLVHPSVKASLFWGLYESAEIRFVNRYLPLSLDVIELGSSIGVVSCFIRKRIAAERKLICVEADARLEKQWIVNLRLNQCAHNVRLVNKAISYHNKTEKTSFIVGMNSTDGRLGGSTAGNHAIQVNCTRLSDIISEHMTAGFSLVCDIEGAEVEMLHSEPEVFSRCRFALMELHRFMLNGKTIEVDDTLQILIGPLGFRLVDRNGPVVCLAK